MRRIIIPSVALAAAVLIVGATLSAGDIQVGAWKLNVEKSKYSPGPAPKSGTVKIEAWEDGIKVTVEQIPAEGNAVRFEYAAKFDGKDYPFKGNPNADTIAYKKIDDYTFETVAKKGGKVTTTSRIVYSRDGKTRTNTQTGTNAQGQAMKNTIVYERQ